MNRSTIFIAIAFSFICLSGNCSLMASEKQTITQEGTTPQFQQIQFKTGLSIGWDYPYSTGAEFSILINEMVDTNFGFGFGLSGAKIGIGLRLFPVRNNDFSPMFGAFLYRASGISNMNVNVNNDYAVYDITPDTAFLLNTGIRYRFGKGHYFITGIGYSTPFKGDKAVYRSGSTLKSVETFANTIATGGLSFNMGLLIKITKGSYRIN